MKNNITQIDYNIIFKKSIIDILNYEFIKYESFYNFYINNFINNIKNNNLELILPFDFLNFLRKNKNTLDIKSSFNNNKITLSKYDFKNLYPIINLAHKRCKLALETHNINTLNKSLMRFNHKNNYLESIYIDGSYIKTTEDPNIIEIKNIGKLELDTPIEYDLINHKYYPILSAYINKYNNSDNIYENNYTITIKYNSKNIPKRYNNYTKINLFIYNKKNLLYLSSDRSFTYDSKKKDCQENPLNNKDIANPIVNIHTNGIISYTKAIENIITNHITKLPDSRVDLSNISTKYIKELKRLCTIPDYNTLYSMYTIWNDEIIKEVNFILDNQIQEFMSKFPKNIKCYIKIIYLDKETLNSLPEYMSQDYKYFDINYIKETFEKYSPRGSYVELVETNPSDKKLQKLIHSTSKNEKRSIYNYLNLM